VTALTGGKQTKGRRILSRRPVQAAKVSVPPRSESRGAQPSPSGFRLGVTPAAIVLIGRDSRPRHCRAAAAQFDRRAPDGVFSLVSLKPVAMDHPPITDLKFEAALAELEAIVHSMEDGKLDLEASIASYRRGMELMKHCQGQLADAEQQVRVLENGQFKDVDPDSLDER
jgi:exodeoxyribonuclease VII small subunit